MKLKEYYLKDCEGLLPVVKEKLMDPVCGLKLTNNQDSYFSWIPEKFVEFDSDVMSYK